MILDAVGACRVRTAFRGIAPIHGALCGFRSHTLTLDTVRFSENIHSVKPQASFQYVANILTVSTKIVHFDSLPNVLALKSGQEGQRIKERKKIERDRAKERNK